MTLAATYVLIKGRVKVTLVATYDVHYQGNGKSDSSSYVLVRGRKEILCDTDTCQQKYKIVSNSYVYSNGNGSMTLVASCQKKGRLYGVTDMQVLAAIVVIIDTLQLV